MKKLLRGIPWNALLSVALLFGSNMPNLNGAKESRFEDHTEDEEVSCTTCCVPYTEQSVAIQQDCNHPENLHFCLPCSLQLLATHNASLCGVCRNPNYKIHDPRVRKDSFTYIHHRQTPLNPQEQNQLRQYLGSMGNHRISLKAAPDTLVRQCSTCKHTVEKDKVVIELGCGHNLCLRDAAKLTQKNKLECPICKAGPSTITDPLEMNAQNRIILKYLQRPPTTEETTLLKKIRSSVRLFQEHIAQEQRVPSSTKTTTQKTNSEKKAAKPAADKRPEAPSKHKKELRIVPGTYPLSEQSTEDIRINKEHLPEHLDPQEWQVVIVPAQGGRDTEIARMKRAKKVTNSHRTFSRTSPREEVQDDDQDAEKVPDLLKGYSGDLIGGLCLGLLIGQEYHKPNRFMPKPVWLAYGAATLGTYSLIKKNNPGRPFKSRYALRWAAGLGAGIAIHAYLGSKK